MSFKKLGPLAVLLVSGAIFFAIMIGMGFFGESEHRERTRVSEAYVLMLSIFESSPQQLTQSDRSRLGLPKRVTNEDADAANEMPRTIDFTIDLVDSKLVATFADDQEAISGGTIYLIRLGPAGAPLKCGGTIPAKYLPIVCRQ